MTSNTSENLGLYEIVAAAQVIEKELSNYIDPYDKSKTKEEIIKVIEENGEMIDRALEERGINLTSGAIVHFFDRDGTLNIKNILLQAAIKNSKNGAVMVGTLTGKLPEEISDNLKGFMFLGAAGGGMVYLPDIEEKIAFEIPKEKIEQVEEIYKEILRKHGVEEDIIQSIRLQYNAYNEEEKRGQILLLSGEEVEKSDYIDNRGYLAGRFDKETEEIQNEIEEKQNKRDAVTSEEEKEELDKEIQLLKEKLKNIRNDRKIVEMTAVEGGEIGKEILEELYERLREIDGIEMVPPGACDDRTGKQWLADITKFHKGHLFDIILEILLERAPYVIPHFMGNSTNDVPAIKSAWAREDGIVSMVLPPNLEHGDTPLIAMLANFAVKHKKSLVLVEPGPDKEFGSEYATDVINHPEMLANHLFSKKNIETINKYATLYKEMEKEGKIPKSLLMVMEDLEKLVKEEKQPKLAAEGIGQSLINVAEQGYLNVTNFKRMIEQFNKLYDVAEINEELKGNNTNDEREVFDVV